MLLRIVTGTVAAGRETDFVDACRGQVLDHGRSAGLVAFMGGYRRVDGVDRFVLASTWESEADAVAVAGDADHLAVADVMAGIATIQSYDRFDSLGRAFRGILDAPGGIVRVSHARVSAAAHGQLLEFMRTPPRDRSRFGQPLLLGWAVGERPAPDGEGYDVVAISAWPSPLVIEAVSDGESVHAPLWSGVAAFATDFQTEQFRAVALELPDEMADVGARRVIAARFAAAQAADETARALDAAVPSTRAAPISVAPLGAPDAAGDGPSFVLVARVAINEYGRAERLISDRGGDVILSQVEAG